MSDMDMTEQQMLDFRMPFGKHKGKKMREIPCSYLVWLSGQEPKGSLKDIIAHFEDEIHDAFEDAVLGDML